jgi:hypothetical protein
MGSMPGPTPLPLSLTGRLLCAAQQSYEIVTTGPAPDSPATPSPPPSSLVGWTGRPQAFVSGDDNISAVLVGETPSEIIIAYRGTEPFDSPDHERMVLDWLDDFILPLVNAPNVPGSVHYGFSHAVNGLWSSVEGALAALPKGKPIYVTGHSKGGAMANIAAVKLVAAGRCGDAAFAAGFAQAIKHATRWEFQDDIVPMLPPSDAFLMLAKGMPFLAGVLNAFIPSYVPVGDLHFINWQNQVVGDSPALEAHRIGHLLDQLAMLGCGHVISDHSIGPGSGAAAVICNGIWGPPPRAAAPAVVAATAPAVGAALSDVPF